MWYDNNFSKNLELDLINSVKTLTNQQILDRLNKPNRTYYPKESDEIRHVLQERGWQINGERGAYTLGATRPDAYDLQNTPIQCHQITVDGEGRVTTEQWTAK
jgi:hypothetical protein